MKRRDLSAYKKILETLVVDQVVRVKADEWPRENWVYQQARMNRQRVAYLAAGDERVLIRIE